MRQNLQDGDKMMEMSRKIGTLESQMTRLKAESYQLKVRLDESRGAKEKDKKEQRKKEAKKIFEYITFDDEKKEEIKEEKKENLVPNFGERPIVDEEVEKKKKKTVSISSAVECYEEDEGMKEEVLKEETEEKKEVGKKKRERKFNEVIDARDEKYNECKQQ